MLIIKLDTKFNKYIYRRDDINFEILIKKFLINLIKLLRLKSPSYRVGTDVTNY